ncbi:hypothetical protein [Flavobacterium restrictum]|uniref:Uncharacterized protein n=1 Tax=Flavobacterium restrictum TaxID=2594428 RepID=A0A553DMW6_9FLAO|nr:hypothetical protein [Flavobacterium restrictum]TRX34102.1 hypothetical protein FNW21_15935 [Flavobacterium restrictum]
MTSKNQSSNNSEITIKKTYIYKTIAIIVGIVIFLYAFANYIISEERTNVAIEKFKESIPK